AVLQGRREVARPGHPGRERGVFGRGAEADPDLPTPLFHFARRRTENEVSELETLGNVSLRGTALDCTLLPGSDGSCFLQLIDHVGDTTHELAMIAGTLGACRNKVRDRAATWEQGIEDPRIAAIN